MTSDASDKTKSASTSTLWSDAPRRLATVSIGVPIVWQILSFPMTAYIFFLCVHALCCWEWVRLEKIAAGSPILFLGISGILACVSNDQLFSFLLTFTTGIFCWMQKHHWTLGLLLVTMPFRTWLIVSQDFPSTMFLLLVVWNCDTGALVSGRLSKRFTGEKRLYMPSWVHKISPAKSMEGFLGGLVGGTWTAVHWVPFLVKLFSVECSDSFRALWLDAPFLNRVGLGLVLSFLAIAGDLVESSVKRHCQTKDSGNLLPGHGGILDRFDSSLLAVLFYHYLHHRQY